jgi:hypothetical protein
MDKRVSRLEATTKPAMPRITEIVRHIYEPGPNGPVFVETLPPILLKPAAAKGDKK